MFCKLFGFQNGDGIFTPGGSLSNMYGMVLARYKAQPDVKSIGCFGFKPLVAFTSEESHYSIQKAIHWLGIGTNNLIKVKTDQNGCMLIDNLIEHIEHVLESNRQPFFVNATAGTTVLGSFDNLNEIAEVCGKYNLWLHVDVRSFRINFCHYDFQLLFILLELSWWQYCVFLKIQKSSKWNSSCQFYLMESS